MHRFEIAAGLAPPVPRAAPIPIGRRRVLWRRWARRRARVSTLTLVPVGVPWDLVFHGAGVSTAVASATGAVRPRSPTEPMTIKRIKERLLLPRRRAPPSPFPSAGKGGFLSRTSRQNRA